MKDTPYINSLALAVVVFGLLLSAPASLRAQVDFSNRTPLALFSEMAADTVTNAMFNHFRPHPELEFVVVAPSPGLDVTGETRVLVALDFNNDGFEDVLQGNKSYPGENPSQLLINQGDGTFRRQDTAAIPTNIISAAAGDLDNDGWTDLVLVSARGGRRSRTWIAAEPVEITASLLVLRNLQGTGWAEPEVLARTRSRIRSDLNSTVLLDFDRDSFLDLALVAGQTGEVTTVQLWRGSRAGLTRGRTIAWPLTRATSAATQTDRYAGTLPMLAAFDYDQDGDQDLLLQDARFMPLRPRLLQVMINDGPGWRGPFVVSAPTVARCTPPIVADANNDGRWELFFGVSDFDGGRNALCVRDSTGRYQDVGRQMGLWAGYNYTTSAVWSDLNNDGWLDLVQCLAFNESAWTESVIHLNEAGALFSNVSDRARPDLGPGSYAAVALDVEHDGDLDLLLGHMTLYSDIMPPSDTALDLVRNDSRTGNWLAVRLEGTVSNRSAFGATIALHAGGQRQLQAVPNGVHWGVSQPPATAHFGLAGLTAVDSLVVVWPNGARENFGPQTTNRRLSLREGATGTPPEKPRDPDHP